MNNSCMEINGYQPDPNYPNLIKNIDRLSATRPFACGMDKICISKPSMWKDILFYIGIAMFFAGALAVMVIMMMVYKENKIV